MVSTVFNCLKDATYIHTYLVRFLWRPSPGFIDLFEDRDCLNTYLSRPLFSLLSLHNQQVGSWAWSKGQQASSSKRSETKYLATTQFHFLRTFTAACVSVSSRLDYCCSLHLRRDFFFFRENLQRPEQIAYAGEGDRADCCSAPADTQELLYESPSLRASP